MMDMSVSLCGLSFSLSKKELCEQKEVEKELPEMKETDLDKYTTKNECRVL